MAFQHLAHSGSGTPMDPSLINAVVQRLGERLPESTNRSMKEFLSDKLTRQTVSSLVEMSSRWIVHVLRPITSLLENISVLAQNNSSLLSSQIFLFRLVAACLNRYWKSTAIAQSDTYEDIDEDELLDLMHSSGDENWHQKLVEKGITVPDPRPFDTKIAGALTECIARVLNSLPPNNHFATHDSTMSTDPSNQFNNTIQSVYNSDPGLLFGFSLVTVNNLLSNLSFEKHDLQLVAGQIVCFLSSCNWDIIYQRVRSVLNRMIQGVEDESSDLFLLAWSQINAHRLSIVLKELNLVHKSLKKNHLQTFSPVLYQAANNWFCMFQNEFAGLQKNIERMDGLSDSLFESFSAITDNKRKQGNWTTLTALILLSPDVIANFVGVLLGNSPNKANPLARFLEQLWASSQKAPMPNMTAICVNDLFRTGSFLSANSCKLAELLNLLEHDVKTKLLSLDKDLVTNDPVLDSQIRVDLMTSILRRNGAAAVNDLIPVYLSENTPTHYTLTFIQSCMIFGAQSYICESVNSTIPTLCVELAPSLRKLFGESVKKALSSSEDALNRTGSMMTLDRQKKKDGKPDVEQKDIIMCILYLYKRIPEISIWLKDNSGPEELRYLLTNITTCILGEQTSISKLSAEILVKLMGPPYRDHWGPPAASTSAFWNLSTHVLGLLGKSFCETRENEKLVRLLDTVSEMLSLRQSFLNAHPETTQVALDYPKRSTCLAQIEASCMLALCSVNSDIISHGLTCLRLLCMEITRIEGSEVLEQSGASPPLMKLIDLYSEFADFETSTSSVISGRMAFQRRFRKSLRNLSLPSEGLMLAWEESQRRWQAFFPYLLRKDLKEEEDPVSSATDITKKIVGESLATRVFQRANRQSISKAETNNHLLVSISDDKGDWQNVVGFLLTVGGAIAKSLKQNLGRRNAIHSSSAAGSKEKYDKARDTRSMISNLEQFVSDISELLVCDSTVIRSSIRDLLSNDLNPTLFLMFYSRIEQQFQNIFLQQEWACTEDATLLVNQSIIVLKSMIERIVYASDEFASVDISPLILKYIMYLSKLGRSPSAVKMKIRMCTFIELLLAKRDLIALAEEIKLKNKILEMIVEWTSEFTENKDTLEVENMKLTLDLDVNALRLIKQLVLQLPLQSTDDIRDLSAKSSNALETRSRTFNKYFQFFVQIIRRCNNSETDFHKDYLALKEYAILALSNMLYANIEAGLKHALSLSYHEDSQLRTSLMLVLSNILSQGIDSGAPTEIDPAQLYQKLVSCLYEPSLDVVLALCEVCPASEMDDLASLLLVIFDAKQQRKVLLQALIEKEFRVCESTTTLFRRNSVGSKILTMIAKTSGLNFLTTKLSPILEAALASDDSYEINPLKEADPGKIKANMKKLEGLCENIIKNICDDPNFLPVSICEVCRLLRKEVEYRFPAVDFAPVLGGFLFLRYICPAIVAPDILLPGGNISNKFRRGLLLCSKVIQNISNGVEFGAKEPYMLGLNSFVQTNIKTISGYLRVVAERDDPANITMHADINEVDLKRLHRFCSTNLEAIGKELTNLRSITMQPQLVAPIQTFTSQHSDEDPLNLRNNRNTGSHFTKTSFDTLASILTQLGPPEDVQKESEAGIAGFSGSDNKAFEGFMRRNDGRDIEHLKQFNMLYEGGLSKEKNSLFYVISRRIVAVELDLELLIYYVLLSFTQITAPKFELIIDLSYFGEENEIPVQWMHQFLQLLSQDIWDRMVKIYVYNVNNSFKKYAKSIQRIIPSRLTKKFHFVGLLSEFYEYISPIELRLPQSTVSIEQDCMTFTPVSRSLGLKGTIGLSMKINSEAVQLTCIKKQDVLGFQVVVNDVMHLQNVDASIILSDKSSEEFVLVLDNGRGILTLNSNRRDRIVQIIRENKQKLQSTQQFQSMDRVVRPKDIPGSLLNLCLLNCGSEDGELRTSAYNLLFVLCQVFKFDIKNQKLMSGAGLSVSKNSIEFICRISHTLSKTASHLTYEFLKESIAGISKINTEQKYLCLEYIIPWISNVTHLESGATETQSPNSKIFEILKSLIDLTVREKQLFVSIQQRIWAVLGRKEDLIEHVLNTLICIATESNSSKEAVDVIADICTTLASVSPVVPGTMIALNITATSVDEPNNLALHSKWKDLSVLIHIVSSLSFNNLMNVQTFLAELLDIIVMLMATGSNSVRSDIYRMTLNIIHSLCTSDFINETQIVNLNILYSELIKPKSMLLFGLKSSSLNMTIGSEKNIDKISFSALENIVGILIDSLAFGAPNIDTAAAWRSRWTTLTITRCFHSNPAIQPRAFVTLGILSRGFVDDDLIRSILFVSQSAALSFDDNDRQLIISIVMCLTSLLENATMESRYLGNLFWMAVILAAIGHNSLFSPSMYLIQTIVKSLFSRGYFLQMSPSEYLLSRRAPCEEILHNFENTIGVSFKTDFAVAIGALLLKGLKQATTKAATMSTLIVLLELSAKYYSLNGENDNQDRLHPNLIGYILPLLTIADRNEFAQLFWIAGLNEPSTLDPCDPNEPQRQRFVKLFSRITSPDPDQCELMVNMLVAMLEYSDSERESIFLYRLLAEAAENMPHVLQSAQKRLLPRIKAAITSSLSVGIMEAIYRILEAGVGSDEPPISGGSNQLYLRHGDNDLMSKPELSKLKQKSTIECLQRLGFKHLLSAECSDFLVISRNQKYAIANILGLYIEAFLSTNQDYSEPIN